MRMTHRNLLALLLCIALLLGATGARAQSYTPGTYTGSTLNGRGGKLEVAVEFSADSIVSITIGESLETQSIASAAFEAIPADVIEYQSLAVDSVASATITSAALLEAIADAVAQAGGDVEALKAKTFEKELSTQVHDIKADVVVVGAGSAGMAAALSAAQHGASSVAVFEKSASIGGNGLISAGLVSIPAVVDNLAPYRADNTQIYDDYVAAFVEGGPLDEEEEKVWDKFVADYEAWLEGDTTKVFDSYEFSCLLNWRSTRTDIPSRLNTLNRLGDFLDWFIETTHVELSKQISITGYPWPNFTPVKGATGGIGWMAAMENTIEKNNYPVDFYLSTPVTELTTDEAGNVTGVKAIALNGETYNVTAEKGVILCTGGFGANGEMIRENNVLFDNLPEVIPSDNCPGDTGDGIVMAEAVGAGVAGLTGMQWLPTASAYEHGTSTRVGNVNSMFMVNKEGVRFVDESISRNELCSAIFAQTDGMAYLISDLANSGIVNGLNSYQIPEESLIARGLLLRGESIAELGEKMGLESGVLEATVDQFNASVLSGSDSLFGRTLFNVGSDIDTENGPYYAYAIAPAVHITYGGVIKDEYLRVTDAQGGVIQGLYAAGEVTNGGAGISGAMTDGYNAAKYIMENG